MIRKLGVSVKLVLAVVLWTPLAMAQTTTPTGQSAPPPPGVGDKTVDLPIQAPVYLPAQAPLQPINPVPPGLTPPPAPPPAPPSMPQNPNPPQEPTDQPGNPTPEPPIEPTDDPPPTIFGEEIQSENDTIFYVLDVSGSMGWDEASYIDLDGRRRSGHRLDRAKVEISRSILGLSDNFRFNIVTFDCGMSQWQQDMQDANDTNKQRSLGWINGQSPGGATATGPGTALALDDRENMSVVLLTDGAPNCGVGDSDNGWWASEMDDPRQHREMIRRHNEQGAVINVFGIAADGSQRSFCQRVASESGGSYFDVP